MAEEVAAASPDGLLGSLAEIEGDPTGSGTFERYVWQAKQAVRQWLCCLSGNDGPLFVVCEHVEDLVLVYPERLRFLQLKTRDRGSWSNAKMCDRGLDSLIRSYLATREVDIHEVAIFELWLEGSISEAAETVSFVQDPTSAGKKLRNSLVQRGLRPQWIDDFLGRLVIEADQPTRAYIDPQVLWELGAIWPGRSRHELEAIYERLLDAVEAAQAALAQPLSTRAHLADVWHSLSASRLEELANKAVAPIRAQVLSREMLTSLTPPLPGASAEQLLARMSSGVHASVLELKMHAAGASADTIRITQELRALMEVERQMLLASRANAEDGLARLGERVLTVAEACAKKVDFDAASKPAAAARPGEAIAMDLLSRPADLANCDQDTFFGRDGQLVYGYLGHLSDVCSFLWRST